MDATDDYWESIHEEMNETYTHTWSWVDFRLFSGANVIAFSSGWGDGVYASYVALNDSGRPVAVVTDFQVLDETSS